MQNSWIPPTRKIIQAMDGHHRTGSPKISVRKAINPIIRKEITQKTNPMTAARERGATENPVIPYNE